MKTASEILFEYGIDIMKMNDDFNSQLLFAMERYAEQFKTTPSSTVSIDVASINEQLIPENCPYSHDPKLNTGTLCGCGFDMSQLSLQPSSTVDFEREAEELYPIKYEHSIGQRLINEENKYKREGYITGRKVSLQQVSDGWISCENRLPTIEDCGQRNKKVAALPHHSDADIQFVYYYNVHSNIHSHWLPINFQLQTTSQEGLRELIDFLNQKRISGSEAVILRREILTKANEILNR